MRPSNPKLIKNGQLSTYTTSTRGRATRGVGLPWGKFDTVQVAGIVGLDAPIS